MLLLSNPIKIIPLNIKVLQGESGIVEINTDSLGTEIKLFTNIEWNSDNQ